MSGANDALREELATVAASLRAYLEWQADCGSSGIPRRPRAPRDAGGRRAAPPAPTLAPTSAPTSGGAASSEREDGPGLTASRRGLDAPAFPPVVLAEPDPEPASTPVRSAAPAEPEAPRSLSVLEQAVRSCEKCKLHETRTNTVFSRGNPNARLCFVGEGPGADEDAQGIPFVGRAGQLLDKMIQAMGLDPATDVYVCNIVKCRPPGNRRPEPDEIEACLPYLHEQIANVDPKVIVTLGNTATSALLGTKIGITKVRGSWKLYRGRIPVMPTYHPSYLLRSSPQQVEAKRQAWEDLQNVMKELGLKRPPRAR